MYKQLDSIRVQRSLKLNQYPNIEAAIHDSIFEPDFPEEVVLVLSKKGKLFELNLIAAYVWELLVKPRSVDELAMCLTDLFEVEKDIAYSDVHEVVGEFREFGLIETCNA